MSLNSQTTPAHAPVPPHRWSPIDLRPQRLPKDRPTFAEALLNGAHELSKALESQLELDPTTHEAALCWRTREYTSQKFCEELYIRTGVLLDPPQQNPQTGEWRIQLETGLPRNLYSEAAQRIQHHAFYFWQRDEVHGTL